MATTNWKTDLTHSQVEFKAKHLMITTVTGHFNEFDVTAETDEEDFTKASKIEFTANVDSINTGNEQRDNHLKSADFFDAGNHSQIKFTGKKLTNVSGDEYKLEGDLTMRETTKPVTLNVEFGGMVTDPYGQRKAGFTINGKVSRKEFGLTWDAITEAGSVVVSDEIKIHCEIQLVKQAS
jgi:polyisoprenoid-binding protein YceI